MTIVKKIFQGTNGTEESNEGSNKSEILGNNALETNLAMANFDPIDKSIGEAIAQEAPAEFSSSFAHWVHHGQTLCHWQAMFVYGNVP